MRTPIKATEPRVTPAIAGEERACDDTEVAVRGDEGFDVGPDLNFVEICSAKVGVDRSAGEV